MCGFSGIRILVQGGNGVSRGAYQCKQISHTLACLSSTYKSYPLRWQDACARRGKMCSGFGWIESCKTSLVVFAAVPTGHTDAAATIIDLVDAEVFVETVILSLPTDRSEFTFTLIGDVSLENIGAIERGNRLDDLYC